MKINIKNQSFKRWLAGLVVPLIFLGTVIMNYIPYNVVDKPVDGVYDPKQYLSQQTKQELLDFNKNNEAQLGIYMVDDIGLKSIESASREVARKWKIGYKDSNKGALIFVAVQNRKFRIETSDNLSIDLTDSESRRILEDVKPLMKSKSYDAAVSTIIEKIKEEVNPNYAPANSATHPNFDDMSTGEKARNFGAAGLAIGLGLVFVIVILVAKFFFFGILFLIILAVILGHLKYRKLLKRSKFEYKGYDKLYPLDAAFIKNETWTDKRTERYWEKAYSERSQSDYNKVGKLYPDDAHFVQNASWTAALLASFNEAPELFKENDAKTLIDDTINKKERKFKIFGYALDDIIRFEPASSDDDSSHSSDSHHSGSSGSSSGSSGGGWSGGGFNGGGSSSSW